MAAEDHTYATKKVVLDEYVSKPNVGFSYDGQAYISTDDENLFFRAGDGSLLDIESEDCPFDWGSKVFPQTVLFSFPTPEKYLKTKKG